jgi:hypothetical protein
MLSVLCPMFPSIALTEAPAPTQTPVTGPSPRPPQQKNGACTMQTPLTRSVYVAP